MPLMPRSSGRHPNLMPPLTHLQTQMPPVGRTTPAEVLARGRAQGRRQRAGGRVPSNWYKPPRASAAPIPSLRANAASRGRERAAWSGKSPIDWTGGRTRPLPPRPSGPAMRALPPPPKQISKFAQSGKRAAAWVRTPKGASIAGAGVAAAYGIGGLMRHGKSVDKTNGRPTGMYGY